MTNCQVVIARCGQLNEDGTEVQVASTAAPNFAAPRTGGLFAPSLPTPLTSTPLFGQPSSLGGSTATAGSIFGAGATAAAGAAAAAAASPAATEGGSKTPSSGAGGDGGRGSRASALSGGGGASSGLPGTPSVASVASSFGSLAAAVAAGPPHLPVVSAAAAAAAAAPSAAAVASTMAAGSSRIGNSDTKGGFTTPPSRNRYFASAPSDLAAVAVRMSTGTPQSGGRRSSSPRPPGGAAGAAFDRLDDAGTGWVGEEEFKALVGSAGLPFDAETHGRALLELCSPRLPRARFLEWYAAARKEQRETAAAPAAAGRRGSVGSRIESTAHGGGGSGGSGSSGVAPGAGGLKAAAGDASSANGPRTIGSDVVRAPASPDAMDGGDDSGRGSAADDDVGSDDSDNDEERREERAKAEAAFDQVDGGTKGWVDEGQFEALMEAVGTTYSVEDHKPKLLSICKGGRLEREAFLAWYMEWLFGDEDSSDEESDEEGSVRASGAGAAKVGGFASLLKSQSGGWRCDACLVSNPESASKCLSCEAAKPREEGKVEAGSAAGGSGVLGGSSGASSGGFTFGSPVGTAATAAAAEATGSEAATAAAPSSVATNAAGGFTFGAPPAPAAAATAANVASLHDASSAPSLETNAAGGFTFGASVPEALGSPAGVKPGEERETAAVREDGDSGTDGAVGGDVGSDGSDDGEERREERAKAEAAFDQVDGGTKGWVEEGQFEALMEAVGTTYSVEDHKPKLLSICKGGRLEREAFLAWYMEWLFGDEDSSD
ncbi:unnamed protein product, partial [Hapterophycus canaliculatus]